MSVIEKRMELKNLSCHYTLYGRRLQCTDYLLSKHVVKKRGDAKTRPKAIDCRR